MDQQVDTEGHLQPEADIKAVSATDVRRSAMNYLARREHSKAELREKLLKRLSTFEPTVEPMIDVELDKLEEQGLQSDNRMAEAFARSRVRRGQGPVRIRMELKQKGVSDDLISATLANFTLDNAPVSWSELASEVAERKYANLESASTDMKLRGKVSRFLQQRGFTFDHINHLF